LNCLGVKSIFECFFRFFNELLFGSPSAFIDFLYLFGFVPL
jgi:hypothetical protein